MKAIIKADDCIGCGACVSIEENVFTLNDAGIAEVKKSEISEELQESTQEAAESCPTDAIIVE